MKLVFVASPLSTQNKGASPLSTQNKGASPLSTQNKGVNTKSGLLESK